MIELIKMVYSTVSAVHSRTYLEVAPQNATYPFVVIKYPTSIENLPREDFIIEVDIWDNKTDTTAIETLTNNIDAVLHKKHYYSSGKLQCDIYRISRSMIPDPDEHIRRRQLRYEAKTYL